MAFADRDYRRALPQFGGGSSRGPSRFAGAPVVKWLLITNIAVYFLDMLLFRWSLWEWGYLSVFTAIENRQVWRLLAFQFLHADGLHLLMNMMGLFFFGHFAERWWGSRKFMVYYLLTGLAGAFFYMLLFYVGWFGRDPIALGNGAFLQASERPMVGASAGIFGILACVAVIAPNLRVLLFFVIPMSMRQLAYFALIISVVYVVFRLDNAGGHAGHFGGAIFGFVLMKFPDLLNFVEIKRKGRRSVIDVRARQHQSKMGPRVSIDLDDSEVDRILDKVSREGLQSLTDEERDLLNREAKK